MNGAMVKRKFNRIIALTMACFVFTVALFLECVTYKAESVAGTSVTSSGLLSINDSPWWEDYPLPDSIENVVRETSGGLYNYIYFKKAYLSGFAFNSSSDVYAYKVVVSPINREFTSRTNVEESRLVMGTYDDILSGKAYLGYTFDNASVSTFWITTNYQEMSIKLGAYVSMYQVDIPTDSGYTTQSPVIGFTGQYNITYTPYTMEGYADTLLEDIKAELEAHGDLTYELKALLEEGLYTSYGMPLVDILDSISSNLTSIKYDYLWQMRQDLKTVVSDIKLILEEEEKQTSWLEKIWNSIQDFFTQTDEEKDKSDKFDSQCSEQSSELGSIVEGMDKVDKPSADSIKPDIGSQLPIDNNSYVSTIFSCIYVFQSPVTMLTLVFMFGLIAYVLFGKR